jgi:hypothetical protein
MLSEIRDGGFNNSEALNTVSHLTDICDQRLIGAG